MGGRSDIENPTAAGATSSRRGRASPSRVARSPLQAEGSAALFEVVQRRYLKGSIILTTNRGIASWGEIFDDPMIAAAMLDRLLHRSVVLQIEGESYRMRAHRARAEALRAASRP